MASFSSENLRAILPCWKEGVRGCGVGGLGRLMPGLEGLGFWNTRKFGGLGGLVAMSVSGSAVSASVFVA
jgi:hypothetical protein